MNNPSFTRFYDGIEPYEKLKKAPADFPADFPDIDLLKNKHFFSSHYPKTGDVIKDNFGDVVKTGLQAVKPLVDFINFSVEI